MNKTIDQRRAEHAWNAIAGLKSKFNDGYVEGAKDYAREAKKLPVRIMAAGLGQALAFIMAKSNKKEKLKMLQEHLADWVIKQRPIQAKHPENLIESIIKGDSDFLRRATDETLAYLQWLNRFAEAEGLSDEME